MKVRTSPFSIGQRINEEVLRQLRRDFDSGIAQTAKKAKRLTVEAVPAGHTDRRHSYER